MHRVWLVLVSVAAATTACERPPLTGLPALAEQTDAGCCANKYDLLFVIDDGPAMASVQQKLFAQLPLFMQVLQNIPDPPSLHVAVVSGDLERTVKTCRKFAVVGGT